ncbi:MAG: hypothetical protein HQ581_03865 [Planctomycetes bacterium]|nr:hypothetical protein [Planctomycetota bacterium]
MRLHSLTFDELTAYGVDPRFARILTDPDSYHPDLSIHVGKTNWDYFIPANVTNVVPLWDSNADSFVRWNRNGSTEYVWLFHDDPNWTLIAASEQGIMAKLWQDWIEFQDSDDECRRFADAIGFRHCEEGLALLDNDYDAFTKWMRELTDNVA